MLLSCRRDEICNAETYCDAMRERERHVRIKSLNGVEISSGRECGEPRIEKKYFALLFQLGRKGFLGDSDGPTVRHNRMGGKERTEGGTESTQNSTNTENRVMEHVAVGYK